jgi:protein-S-isoprenylcysteine O-methyltransferase Ste14
MRERLVAAPLLFLALADALPALAFVPGWTVPFPGDTAVQLFGLGLWAAGALLGLAAVRALGPFMAVDIAVWEDHELVTRGPYARIRHPAYTGAMLMAAGAALFLLHVLLFAVAFLTVALAVRRARLEESLLASTPPVAKAYRAYMARTGRFLPRRRTSRARFF